MLTLLKCPMKANEFLDKFKAGVHNIRLAGQMWPAEAFFLACKAHNLANLACLFPKNIL